MRRGLAGTFQPFGEEADGVVVLRVHHHQRAGFPRGRENLQHLDVGQRQVLVGHEHLERGVAVIDHGRQFLAQHLRCGIGNDEMEADVDETAPLRFGVIGIERGAQALPLLLHAERHHQRVAAERRGPGAAFEVVGHDDAGAAGLCEMHVAVDAARHDQTAAGVDDLRGVAQILAEHDDAAIADADIAFDRVGGRDHGSAADHHVELRHVLCLSLMMGGRGADDGL